MCRRKNRKYDKGLQKQLQLAMEIVFEFYDKLREIWGGSPSTEPLPFGVETGDFVSAVEESEQTEPDVEIEKEVDDLNEDEEDYQIEFPSIFRKRAATNQIPLLVDNKRKHLERNLSAAQRDQLILNEAKEEGAEERSW